MGFVAAAFDVLATVEQTKVPILVACGIIAILLVVLVKQFILHPLAPYPGPILGRCTSLYAAYHAYKGTLHTDIYRCHQIYGPVVRYSPTRLLINTNTAVKEIHAYNANTFKSSAYQAMVHGAPNTLTIRNKGDHARRRKLLSMAFSESKIMSYENIVQKHVRSLCENMEDCARSERGSLDMSPQSDYFAFDVMSEVVFGMRYNALKETSYRFVTEALEASNIRVSTLIQSSFLGVGKLDRYLFPTSIQARNRFLGFISSLLRDRFKTAFSERRDVFSFLETAKDPEGGSKLSKTELRAECATLVVAGSDTSSTALAGTLFYLSRNQAAYERICKEIRGKFQAGQEIRIGPQLHSCTYLRACIDEALRMSPPAGGALWREIGPGGVTVDSLKLPAGIDVGIGIYSLHHNEKYFPDPFKYNPERWIVGDSGVTKESVELARSAFVPFSSGPRGCVGKGFAYHALSLALAHIIVRFDFCRADENREHDRSSGNAQGNEEFLLKDHITGAKNGPVLRFTLRGGE